MKTLITIIFVLLSFPMSSHAMVYYVAQNSFGKGDGSSITNAMSVEAHNKTEFSPNDIIYLTGNIKSELIPPSSGNLKDGYITYDGYENGNCDPINKDCDCSHISRKQYPLDQYGVKIKNKSYLIFQDIEISECEIGIFITDNANHLIFKRNKIHDMSTQGIGVRRNPKKYGGTGGSGNNIVIGGTFGDGNEIYNIGCGTAGADIVIQGEEPGTPYPTRDFIISYNHLYAEDQKGVGSPSDRGIDGIVLVSGVHNVLIEYNSIHGHNNSFHNDPYGEEVHGRMGLGENAIDIKEDNYNVIVRYNHLYDHIHEAAIVVQSDSYKIYIYGNNISENLWGALHLKDANSNAYRNNGRSTEDIHFWSNIVKDNIWRGIGIEDNGGDPVKKIKIYNNFFHGNVTDPLSSSHLALWIHGYSTNIDVVNNIFLNNWSRNQNFAQAYISVKESSIINISSNIFYNDGHDQDNILYWKDKGYVKINDEIIGSQNMTMDPGKLYGPLGGFSPEIKGSVLSNAKILNDDLPSITIMEKNYDLTYSIGLLTTSNWQSVPPKPQYSYRENEKGWQKGPYIINSNLALVAPVNVKLY